MRHVVFRVERERYALPLAAVREVVVPGVLSVVPRAPDAVRGIMNLRGRVVTVVDLKLLFALGPPDGAAEGPAPHGPSPVDPSRAPPGQVLILDRGRRDLGLLVAEVEGIVPVENVAPAPSGGASVRGLATLPPDAGSDRVVTVLDAGGLDAQVAGLFGGR